MLVLLFCRHIFAEDRSVLIDTEIDSDIFIFIFRSRLNSSLNNLNLAIINQDSMFLFSFSFFPSIFANRLLKCVCCDHFHSLSLLDRIIIPTFDVGFFFCQYKPVESLTTVIWLRMGSKSKFRTIRIKCLAPIAFEEGRAVGHIVVPKISQIRKTNAPRKRNSIQN